MNDLFVHSNDIVQEAGVSIAETDLPVAYRNNYRAEEVQPDQLIETLDGTDLFSRFTADIINLRVLFTR